MVQNADGLKFSNDNDDKDLKFSRYCKQLAREESQKDRWRQQHIEAGRARQSAHALKRNSRVIARQTNKSIKCAGAKHTSQVGVHAVQVGHFLWFAILITTHAPLRLSRCIVVEQCKLERDTRNASSRRDCNESERVTFSIWCARHTYRW